MDTVKCSCSDPVLGDLSLSRRQANIRPRHSNPMSALATRLNSQYIIPMPAPLEFCLASSINILQPRRHFSTWCRHIWEPSSPICTTSTSRPTSSTTLHLRWQRPRQARRYQEARVGNEPEMPCGFPSPRVPTTAPGRRQPCRDGGPWWAKDIWRGGGNRQWTTCRHFLPQDSTPSTLPSHQPGP